MSCRAVGFGLVASWLLGCTPALAPATSPVLETPACSAPAGLRWLEGQWESDEGGRRNVETWSIGSNGQLEGWSRTCVDGELVHTEALEIVGADGVTVYRASPQGQASHDFQLQECGNDWVRFADPSHDWPQSITYRREGNSMSATVEGEESGVPRTATWTWSYSGVGGGGGAPANSVTSPCAG